VGEGGMCREIMGNQIRGPRIDRIEVEVDRARIRCDETGR